MIMSSFSVFYNFFESVIHFSCEILGGKMVSCSVSGK